ncbi:MAG TPA: DUF5372 family protein [Oligoflexus sp.]|uniref:DUF5372 family protein n=1 Tax=Oligoflexus sp. TaxID=1971216 RepID=UPI002D3EC4F1|nr:DUF5372 family protein [Oligoflexus sp.]HYX37661.1 DUF5372 family protein [Oligoflexus sp.]
MNKLSNALQESIQASIVTITHPFHPKKGLKFRIYSVRRSWQENRVLFYDNFDKLCSVPLEWTDMADQDPFVKMANGKAYFRFQDLLTLVQLIRQSKEKLTGAESHKPKVAKSEQCHGPTKFEGETNSSES